MGIRRKGIEQVRTLAMVRGSGVHSSERHAHQFKVASLELERSRRMKERQANLRRIEEIDARLREINDQLQTRYGALGLQTSEQGAEKTGSGSARAAEPVGGVQHVLRY
jgi:uncharacterized membrane protein YccC